MYYQTGSMRNIQNDSMAGRSHYYDKQDDYNNDKQSRYEKSQIFQQKSKIIYDQQKSQKINKINQYKDINRMIPINVKYSDKQYYIVNLRIQLIKVCQKNNCCMNINLSDDNDSLFLWNFFIRETQYLIFKDQHSLKVDFQRFPQVISDFINKVDSSISQNNRYEAVLDIKKGNQEAELKFLQVGKLKSNLLFTLKYKRANDQQLKIYLSQKFDRQRKQNIKLSNQLSNAQHQLNLRKQELQKLGCEYSLMQKQKNIQISQLQKRQKQKIRQITLRIQQEHIQKQKQQTQRTSRRINQLQTKLQQYKQKYDQLYNNYQRSNQKIINLQSNQNSLKIKNNILQQQSQSYQKINKQLKNKQIKLNQQYHILKNQNTRLSCCVQSLQDKVKEKQQRLNQSSQIKSTNVNQISTLQENIRQDKKKIERLQQKNQHLQSQLTKLKKKNDDISAKYQKKKQRFGESKQIITLQQQKINDKQKQINKLLDIIKDNQNYKQQFQRQIKNKDIKIDQLKNSISGNDQHIEDQRKIITQLNKKLNQKTIGGIKSYAINGPLPTYTNLSSTSIVGRDFSSTISSNSQSRIRYSPSPLSTNPLNEKTVQRIAPPFRKYRQGIQNDRQQQNTYNSQTHSRSPIINRLNQQIDPQDIQKNKQKTSIGPIKFKKNQ